MSNATSFSFHLAQSFQIAYVKAIFQPVEQLLFKV